MSPWRVCEKVIKNKRIGLKSKDNGKSNKQCKNGNYLPALFFPIQTNLNMQKQKNHLANKVWGCFFITEGDLIVKWINKSGEYEAVQEDDTMYQ